MSFALIPQADPSPLDSKLVVVNKEGDVELYAFHDTPKHPTWSARGDFVIGAGTSYRLTRGIHNLDPPLEPWDIIQTPVPKSRSLQNIRDRDMPAKKTVPPESSDLAEFGKSSQDDFPALVPSRRESSLTATRHMKGRTYSPASIRKYALDQTQEQDTAAPEIPVPTFTKSNEQAPVRNHLRHTTNRANRKKASDDVDTSEQAQLVAKLGIRKVIEDDISLIMRSRAIQGYTLNNVR